MGYGISKALLDNGDKVGDIHLLADSVTFTKRSSTSFNGNSGANSAREESGQVGFLGEGKIRGRESFLDSYMLNGHGLRRSGSDHGTR